jgi:hypothetical protein
MALVDGGAVGNRESAIGNAFASRIGQPEKK